ncbi:MAG: glycogen/starch/alpha-glucan phosphorylase [Saccharofermentanales bacterium]
MNKGNKDNKESAYMPIAEDMRRFIAASSGKRTEAATKYEKWMALSRSVMGRIANNWYDTAGAYSTVRQAHYFSAEFLVGRSLINNLINLGLEEEAQAALKEFGTDLAEMEEQEGDPGLGNGGLGRLAACFLDSCATLDLPVTGYGIMYRYGLFRQDIEDGFQKEYPDTWGERGYPWMVRRDELQVRVHYDDLDIFAVPYDLPVTGFGTNNVNTLRLWIAKPAQEFDFNLFNSQRFDDAVIGRNRVNDIWRVLYPNDTSYDGKVLRVRQQYFFVSASLQDIVRTHKLNFDGDLSNFAQYHSVQLNDTHPVIGIPELMRILTEENGMDWDKAWEITRNTFGYTNHTILAEALEKWDIGIFEYLFEDLYKIIVRINSQFRIEMQNAGMYQDKINHLAPIGDGKVRMAWLAIYGSKSVNGVAALHTKILEEKELSDWYKIWPEKFSNKTNGVTPRRWLRKANPELAALLTELTGSDAWITDLEKIASLKPLASSKETMDRFMKIKRTKKQQLAAYIEQTQGIAINPDSLFDIQIKRLHEYKRQLMNALSILDLYFDIKQNPAKIRVPRTFIFGAKAAPGYFRAKGIIKLINEVARLVNSDKDASEHIKVVFVKNYNVSAGEKLFPAADVSEQISTAGLEASGTGNMKFMMNGAVTHGTYDGANVEIVDAVGWENAFIFGARVENLPAIRSYYNPLWQYEHIPGLKRAVDALVDGTLSDSGTGMFRDIYNALLYGSSWQPADVYYVLGDFEDYRNSRNQLDIAYADQYGFAAKCWNNICASGIFSSDRTIKDYAREIWKIEATKIN